jgi:hypothetical protein
LTPRTRCTGILQNNIYNEVGFGNLVGTLERLGLPFSPHRAFPLAGELDLEPVIHSDRIVAVGSYTLAQTVQRRG